MATRSCRCGCGLSVNVPSPAKLAERVLADLLHLEVRALEIEPRSRPYFEAGWLRAGAEHVALQLMGLFEPCGDRFVAQLAGMILLARAAERAANA